LSTYHAAYEELIRFASQGRLNDELRLAKGQFVERTGELFESDPSFERRLASFLEWYALDRPLSFAPDKRPVHLFLQHLATTDNPERAHGLMGLAQTRLSLFEFVKVKDGTLSVLDLLTNEKLQVSERRRVMGMESGDIFEGRLVPEADTLIFTETFAFHPREARRSIVKVAKAFRKTDPQAEQMLAFVHRVAYLANRSERYKHVDPKKIFDDLSAAPTA
jgi:hypothetical protein